MCLRGQCCVDCGALVLVPTVNVEHVAVDDLPAIAATCWFKSATAPLLEDPQYTVGERWNFRNTVSEMFGIVSLTMGWCVACAILCWTVRLISGVVVAAIMDCMAVGEQLSGLQHRTEDLVVN